MFKKQGTSKHSASTSSGDIKPGFHEATTPTDMGEQASACDMAWAFEELEHCEELSEVQLATVVGGFGLSVGGDGILEQKIIKNIGGPATSPLAKPTTRNGGIGDI